MQKLYKNAYASAGVLLLLGLVLLDDYVHNTARIFAGLLCTSPYWLRYAINMRGLSMTAWNSCDKHEWEYQHHHCGCKKCGAPSKQYRK